MSRTKNITTKNSLNDPQQEAAENNAGFLTLNTEEESSHIRRHKFSSWREYDRVVEELDLLNHRKERADKCRRNEGWDSFRLCEQPVKRPFRDLPSVIYMISVNEQPLFYTEKKSMAKLKLREVASVLFINSSECCSLNRVSSDEHEVLKTLDFFFFTYTFPVYSVKMVPIFSFRCQSVNEALRL